MTQPAEFAEDPPREAGLELGAHDADALLLNLDGYDGPIDVLLQLARDQKVDLTNISILQLARQFLAFVDRATALRLDLAAEYLVMAAWLAYLKSRLLLPKAPTDGDEPSADAMAEALAYQLRRLEAMQNAAKQLWALPQRDQAFFARGFVEAEDVRVETVWDANLYDLLKAYGDIRARKEKGKQYELPKFNLMSMESALERLTRMLGRLPRQGHHSVWTTLQSFLPEDADPLFRRSALSSVLTASLEMAKQGQLEIRQDGLFRPIYLRANTAAPQTDNSTTSQNGDQT